MTQLAIPVTVRPEDINRKQSLGKALEYCAELAGYSLDKELQQTLDVDKGQFSRWLSEQEGIKWEKLANLMDVCGNDAPLLWMLQRRGYDLYSLRKQESITERENRLLREENTALKRVLMGKAL